MVDIYVYWINFLIDVRRKSFYIKNFLFFFLFFVDIFWFLIWFFCFLEFEGDVDGVFCFVVILAFVVGFNLENFCRDKGEIEWFVVVIEFVLFWFFLSLFVVLEFCWFFFRDFIVIFFFRDFIVICIFEMCWSVMYFGDLFWLWFFGIGCKFCGNLFWWWFGVGWDLYWFVFIECWFGSVCCKLCLLWGVWFWLSWLGSVLCWYFVDRWGLLWL